MGHIIAMAGKGGTGKTTLAALIVRLIKEKKLGSILAVDADPNSNLAEALGLFAKQTVGDILDNIASSPDKVPAGMSKDRFIEYEVQTAIQEGEGFDLLTMGRPEGPGCYCYVNNVLRNVMAKLVKDYEYIIIDNEAGLEHLSRRTTRAADSLIVVSDATVQGLKAAKRITDLVGELKIKTKNEFLIINRSKNSMDKQKLKEFPLKYLGIIPPDRAIEKTALNGGSIMDLKKEAISLETLKKLGEPIWQRN